MTVPVLTNNRNEEFVDEREAIGALLSDLQWQIEQMGPRGIKNNAGGPYDPAYYKRGLTAASSKGGLAVADYIKKYLSKPPSAGYKKLEEADALDLACEALIADTTKPYAHLFTPEEQAAAQKRLSHHLGAIERRKDARTERIAAMVADLPKDVDELRRRAAAATDPEQAIAINSAIIELEPGDVVAHNRLGRAYESIGSMEIAVSTFRKVLELDPNNSIATGRLYRLAPSAAA
jgi:tetratricopeptide (TPR) repeat protein